MLKFHKKTLSIVLVGMLAAGTLGTVAAVAGGDINSDGKVDITDLSLLSLYLVDKREFSALQTKAADLDRDGAVALTDLAKLRQYLSKVIDKLVD